MIRDPRYDILFEPIKIGPKTAKNRFYQVPHCDGFGVNMPQGDAAFRSTKAEGGWAVVNTEQCSIHPSADYWPIPETRLWDDDDVHQLSHFTAAVHEYGALAGVELCHSGRASSNRYSREVPLGPSSQVTMMHDYDPWMAQEMDLDNIREFRRWHADAAKRAVRAGFDIVYVYCTHAINLPQQFLTRGTNRRTDEYGGSLKNRMRLLGEMLDDTREAIGDDAALAIRFSVDDKIGPDGVAWEEEGVAVVETFAEVPDIWDVNVGEWTQDMSTSRLWPEAHQEPYVVSVKQLTTKPVVGVGRFTSPDTMVGQIERGILDMIGAARPSIADPFLPKKIEEGRNEDIRECIGCNICLTMEFATSPIRCTQNPAAGEEWRRGWHPERIEEKGSDDGVLIVGAGPAGLEAARAVGARGYDVHLVEAAGEIGGRVIKESRLPGLASWSRVTSYRDIQIGKMANVEIHLNTGLSKDDVLDYGAEVVAIATGSHWRRDGLSHHNCRALPGAADKNVFTPDDVFSGVDIPGPVLVFDDDHYFMGQAIAEQLCNEGTDVILVTPLAEVGVWTKFTLEQGVIQGRLIEKGVEIVTHRNVASIGGNGVELVCMLTNARENRVCKSVILITSRQPDDALYKALAADKTALDAAGIRTLARLGDCQAPGPIQAATTAGHRFARELDRPDLGTTTRRERIALGSSVAAEQT